jgi:hypothetical protein
MKKTTNQKLDDAFDELSDIALELVGDINISQDLGDNYSCFIDKELYKTFQVINKKTFKLHDRLQKETSKKKK